MPGFVGRAIQKAATGAAQKAEKNFEAGKITESQRDEVRQEAAGLYLEGVAREQRKKKEGLLGGLAQAGKVGLATVGTLVATGGNVLAAGSAFTAAAKGVKAKAQADQSAMVENLISNPDTKTVSVVKNILSGIGDAAVRFSQTGVGQATAGVLRSFVANLATGKSAGTSAREAAAAAVGLPGNPNIAESYNATPAQKAVFEGAGISVNVPLPGETWFDRNKWAVPTMIGAAVVGVIVLIVSLFTKKRRR